VSEFVGALIRAQNETYANRFRIVDRTMTQRFFSFDNHRGDYQVVQRIAALILEYTTTPEPTEVIMAFGVTEGGDHVLMLCLYVARMVRLNTPSVNEVSPIAGVTTS
jgi:hypothetical protein